MFRISFRAALAVVLFATLAVGVVGCSAEEDAEPEVTSAWPEADSERVIEEPVEPPRWPLTGLDAPDEAATQARVMSVKVENSPDARPQSGLQSADIVYESVTEGGITRFNVILHSTMPESLGPVRSARMSDTHIVPQYGAMFAFSGASSYVSSALRAIDFDNLSQDSGWSTGYSRSSARKSPHNLYLDVAKIRDAAIDKGAEATQEIRSFLFDYDASEPATLTASEVDIRFSNANRVIWTYDTAEGVYDRVNNGAVHKDAVTGEQLYATNVVVLWAEHVPTGARDVTGSMTYDILLTGSGDCSVFHNGTRFDGTWEAGTDAPPVFKAADGSQIKLAPGNTWFQVVEPNVNIAVK